MLHGLPSYHTDAIPTCGLFMPSGTFHIRCIQLRLAGTLRLGVITAEYLLGLSMLSASGMTAS